MIVRTLTSNRHLPLPTLDRAASSRPLSVKAVINSTTSDTEQASRARRSGSLSVTGARLPSRRSDVLKMPVPTLNVDILYYIMAYSTRKTLLKMMRTSRDMHRGGIKHLLRKKSVLGNERQLTSFLSFCNASGEVAEIAYRMNYLRGLDIDLRLNSCYFDSDDGDNWDDEDNSEDEIQRKPDPTSQALTHFFTSTIRVYAHNFTRLLISRCGGLLGADPDLSLAIASLTTLTYLNLGDATPRIFKLLGSLQSRLVEANIGMDVDLIDPPDVDLTDLLQHSESSLTTLSTYFMNHPAGVGCYPQLHSLNIQVDLPTTRHYVTTFPNLQILDTSECVAGLSDDPEEWMRCRNLNLSQQARDGSWREALRAYVGSILFLYLFGLSCHVTYVHLYAEQEYEAMDFRHVRAVVADTRPEHLVVEVWNVSLALAQAEEIMALFQDAGFQAMRTLGLNLSLCSRDYKVDMEAMLECILAGVASNTSLVGFALRIKWSSIKHRMGTTAKVDDSGKKQRPKRSRVEMFLEGLDAQSVADRLLRSCPSLQAVKVALGKVTVDRGPIDIFFDEKTLGRRHV